METLLTGTSHLFLQEERFAKAVFELHATIFYSYEEQWTHMHGLSIRPQAMQVGRWAEAGVLVLGRPGKRVNWD